MRGSVGIKILISILVILLVVAAALLAVKFTDGSFNKGNIITTVGENVTNTEEPKVVEVKEPKIFKGNDRPIAVMLDNHIDAMPQAGLNSAYLVYEIIVEGGETRLMALFKGVNLDKIGPIRSSRHYYLDYALENDAIYVHFGWSPKAQSDITTLGVNNINGITESSSSFWRATDKEHAYLHSVATSTEDILNISERKGYTTTSTQKSILKYVGNEFDLKSDIDATKVTIPYSSYNGKPYNWVTYEYDNITKRYQRYSRDVKQTDWATGEDVTVKNIIIVKCENWKLDDGENKDRQDIDNIGVLNGYYITNGKAIEITAEKASRTSQTVYKDLQGNEIEVNDGNTFIQICPIDSEVVIEPGVPVHEVDQNAINANTVNANTVNQ